MVCVYPARLPSCLDFDQIESISSFLIHSWIFSDDLANNKIIKWKDNNKLTISSLREEISKIKVYNTSWTEAGIQRLSSESLNRNGLITNILKISKDTFLFQPYFLKNCSIKHAQEGIWNTLYHLFLNKSGLQTLKQLLTIKAHNRLRCVLLWFSDSLPHFLFFSAKLSQAFQVTNFLYIKKITVSRTVVSSKWKKLAYL